MTIENLDLKRKAKNAREAWQWLETREEQKRKLDREAPLARDKWLVIGETLAEGKAQWPSTQAFAAFIEEEELQDIGKDDRAAAIWLYENWQEVQSALKSVPPAISTGLDNPQRIRQKIGELNGTRKPQVDSRIKTKPTAKLHVIRPGPTPSAQQAPFAQPAPEAKPYLSEYDLLEQIEARSEMLLNDETPPRNLTVKLPLNRNDSAALKILGFSYHKHGVLLDPQTARALGIYWRTDKKINFDFQNELTLQLLKRVYQGLASAAHPDKGGSVELMVLLNAAKKRLKL